MLLKVECLRCGYDGGFFLKEVSFEVREREFFGLIGPNGSGKTTLLRAITKVIKLKEGRVVLDGKDVGSLTFKDLAKEVAFVLQNPVIEEDMYVDETVLLGRIPHKKRFQFLDTKEDIRIAEEAMRLTDTLRFRRRRMGSLSGGERQLVLIAKALSQKPKLLVLDEPVSQLDIAHKMRVLDLLKRLNREEGLTIIIVLHDLNLASEYCERLLVLKDGSVYSLGEPHDILTQRTLKEVYNADAVVVKNPISSKPYIIALGKEMRGG
jgi:iron complex transport system ATP-binding protein